MRVNLSLLVIAASAICVNATLYINDPKYCYASDPIRVQLKWGSTTTKYDANRGAAYNPDLCTPKRIWFVSRHGSRYPSVADGDQLFTPTDPIQSNILNNYYSGKTTLCELDAKNIKEWRLDPILLRTDAPADLSATGRIELINMARRYQAIFPGLLPRTYSQPHYFFRNSPVLRTLQTAQAFAEGLFGSAYQQVNYTGGSSPDLFMYAFGACQIWPTLAYDSTVAQEFADGPEFQKMIVEVSNKLGFFGAERLNQMTIIKLMTHCQYESILNHTKPAAFCAAFSVANAHVYEYYKDLQFYYISGYGYTQYRTLFKNMNCYLVKDMLNFLTATDNQKAKLNFGHDVTVQFLMVALGLFDDAVPLTPYNFDRQFSRKWRTSLITPMGANLAVVRYDCIFGEDEVLFELNEKPLQLPGCSANGVCKISVVLNRLSYFAKGNCDTLFCNN